MNKKHILYILLLLSLTINTGCWDLKDLGNRAYIAGIGIDPAENPLDATGEVPNKYKVTVEILVPTLLKEASWRLEKGTDKASVVYTAEGESVEKALRIIQTRVPMTLSLAHLNILIIGEDFAREGLKNIYDYFERNPQVARRLRVLHTQNYQAQDVFSIKPQFSRYISIELLQMSLLESEICLMKFEAFNDLLKEMRATDGISLGARLLLSEEGGFIRHGASVFRDWKLIGWLDKDETRHANWLKGKRCAIVVGQLDKGIFTYYVEERKLKILPKIENNRINFSVDLKVKGSILQEDDSDLNLISVKNLKKLEDLFAQVIKEEVEHALHKAQKDLQTDYLGFGMKLMNKYPQVYEDIDWEKSFPDIPIDVQVETTISHFGQAR